MSACLPVCLRVMLFNLPLCLAFNGDCNPGELTPPNLHLHPFLASPPPHSSLARLITKSFCRLMSNMKIFYPYNERMNVLLLLFVPKRERTRCDCCLTEKLHVMNSFCLLVLAGCQCDILTAAVSQCLWIAGSLGCPWGLTYNKITERKLAISRIPKKGSKKIYFFFLLTEVDFLFTSLSHNAWRRI